jgi:hypothetical protein
MKRLGFCLLIMSLFVAVAQPAMAIEQVKLYAENEDGRNIPLELTSDGRLAVNANVSAEINLDTASLRVVDGDGDEWNVKSSGAGEFYLSGSDVNLATDTELENIHSVLQTLNSNQQNDGIVVKRYDGETIPVKVVNQTTFDTSGLATEQTLQDIRSDTDRRITNAVDVRQNLLSADADSVQIYTENPQGNSLIPLKSTNGGELKVVSTTEDTFIVTVNNQDTDVSIVSSVPLDRAWTLTGNSDSVSVSNLSEISNDTDVGIVSSIPLDRSWNLNEQSDTVNLAQGDIETTNDTDVSIVSETVGLAKSSDITSLDSAVQDTLPRSIVANETLPVSVENQTSFDTDGLATELTLGEVKSILSDVHGDSVIRTYAQYPQRSIFSESTGEYASVSDSALWVKEPDLNSSGGTGVELNAGDTYQVDFGSPVSNVTIQVSSGSGEVTVTDGQSDADKWDLSVYPQSTISFEQTRPRYINIYCVSGATVKWRYER